MKALALLVVITGCNHQITIPVRPCIVDGATITGLPDGTLALPIASHRDDADQRVWNLFNRVSKEIWTVASIGFLACCQFVPIIPDPDTSIGKPGDITIRNTITESTEMKSVREACRVVWELRGFTHGTIVIFARDLIQTDGSPAADVGITYPKPTNTAGLCAQPPALQVADVRDNYSIVAEPDAFRRKRTAAVPPDDYVVLNLAHELGHTLLLGHGNGLDDDGNGRFDSFCDPTETDPDTGGSLMSAAGYRTNLTDLQINLARAAAILVPGAVGG